MVLCVCVTLCGSVRCGRMILLVCGVVRCIHLRFCRVRVHWCVKFINEGMGEEKLTVVYVVGCQDGEEEL